METVLKSAISILLGYLIGSILPAYFLARLKGFDIRQRGSGNPGITNAVDSLGLRAAIPVILYDLAKAPLAIFLAREMGNIWLISYIAGGAALVGHLAPFYLRFRGGEGLTTAVAIGFFAVGMLISEDVRFAYIFTPILVTMALVFFLAGEVRPANTLALIFVPLLVNAAFLYFGLTLHSLALFGTCLYIMGHRITKLLWNIIPEMTGDERKLLSRKWLRPFAIVFPLGAFIYKQITLIVLFVVFFFFVIIEILRFRASHKGFPLSFKKEEESRISSMVVFLAAALLVLVFFPLPIASLALMFVIFGDLLAWCIGRTLGRRGFVNKTWSGTAACLVTCFTIAIIYSSLDLVALPVGIFGALIATVVEIAPLHEDNFVMPVASAIVMTIV